MKKIVGSVLLLAIALTIVLPVIAFASTSAPMTAKEMSISVGGMKPVSCGDWAEGVYDICRQFDGGFFTCFGAAIFALIACVVA
jgi:hypothetical protein